MTLWVYLEVAKSFSIRNGHWNITKPTAKSTLLMQACLHTEFLQAFIIGQGSKENEQTS